MGGTIRNIRDTLIIPSSCKERFLPLRGMASKALQQRGVILAGISNLQGDYEIGRISEPHHLLLYTIEGKGKLTLPDRTAEMTRGKALIAPASTAYGYVLGSETWKIMWFHLDDNDIWWHLRDSPVQLRSTSHIPNLLAGMEGYLSESVHDDHGSQRSANLFAELICSYIDRELEADRDPVSRKYGHMLNSLWMHVSQHLQQPWTVQELAAHVHMSAANFYRICKLYGKESPMQTVTRLRMKQAEELLNSDYPLKMIADMVGYQNPFAFSVAFKRYAGCSPSEYRKMI